MSKLNKNSSGYIFGFALLVILVCGVLLSVVSGALADRQYEEREIERKKFILKAALGDEMAEIEKTEIAGMYENRVQESVVNSKGEIVDGLAANAVKLKNEYRKMEKNGDLKPGQTINLPVYKVMSKDGSKVDYYVIPTYGFGLWDNIWGYMALGTDLNEVKGFVLDHKGETPGLGARITEDKVQNRYREGKKIFKGDELVSITMKKGEGKDYSSDPHAVDGLSGATLTADGVNSMMKNYMNMYRVYIDANKN
ncbi:MAG: Na+-transporting NADH:ubiquinone oxidoreductase subunit C [bacterium]